jgi:hypothetical protein
MQGIGVLRETRDSLAGSTGKLFVSSIDKEQDEQLAHFLQALTTQMQGGDPVRQPAFDVGEDMSFPGRLASPSITGQVPHITFSGNADSLVATKVRKK